MDELPDYLVRMHDEFNVLDSRIEKLDKFIGTDKFNKLTELQQNLLVAQSHSMKSYRDILNMRIKMR